MTAKCLACSAGVSVSDYCRRVPTTMGCSGSSTPAPVTSGGCCKAYNAYCMACAAGMAGNEVKYCKLNKSMNIPGCSQLINTYTGKCVGPRAVPTAPPTASPTAVKCHLFDKKACK